VKLKTKIEKVKKKQESFTCDLTFLTLFCQKQNYGKAQKSETTTISITTTTTTTIFTNHSFTFTFTSYINGFSIGMLVKTRQQQQPQQQQR
jgi:hypothetical protein